MRKGGPDIRVETTGKDREEREKGARTRKETPTDIEEGGRDGAGRTTKKRRMEEPVYAGVDC